MLLSFLFAFPTRAAALSEEQILFPADYRDFFRFGEEGATASPKYIFAGTDYLAFSDDDILTVKTASGKVIPIDITAFSHAHPKRFAEYVKGTDTFLLISDGFSLYAVNVTAPTPTPTMLLENKMMYGSAFTVSGDALYLKGSCLIQYNLTVAEGLLTATGETPLKDFPVAQGYLSSPLFSLTKERKIITPSDDGTELLVGAGRFLISAKPLSLAVQAETAYYLGTLADNTRAVYTVNLSTGTETMLIGLTNPAACGLTVKGNTLYVAYANADTTQKQYITRYTLSEGGATLAGEICAYSSREDRLSSNAAAIAEYEGTVSIADGENNRILTFDGTAYHSLPLEFSPSFLAVSEDYILTGTGNRIFLMKKDGTVEHEIPPLEERKTVKKATFASSGKFYLLLEVTEQGNPFFSVAEYRLQEKAFTEDFISAEKSETVLSLATDLSNHLYLLKSTGVSVYDTQGKLKSTVAGNFSDAYDLQVDFENNLYFLLSAGRIGVLKDGDTQISTLYNLLTDYPYLKNERPVSFYLSFLDKPCYVLYSGFVMKTESVVLSSPVEIEIPTDVDVTAPHSGAKYVTASEGAVFFHFDLSTHNQSQRSPLGYERVTAPTTYIYLADTGAYAYVLRGKNAGFIRKEYLTEITPEQPHTPKEGVPVTTVSCNLYRYPLLYSVYQIKDENAATVSLLKNTALTVTREVQHEGITYYVLSYGESVAYLPQGLVTYQTALPKTESYTLRTVQKVYGETPVLYADAACTQKICDLKDETRIRVYGVKDGVATVVFITETEGTAVQTHGFLPEKFLVNRGSNVGVIALVILLLVLSLVLSTAYLIKRKGNLPPEEEF